MFVLLTKYLLTRETSMIASVFIKSTELQQHRTYSKIHQRWFPISSTNRLLNDKIISKALKRYYSQNLFFVSLRRKCGEVIANALLSLPQLTVWIQF